MAHVFVIVGEGGTQLLGRDGGWLPFEQFPRADLLQLHEAFSTAYGSPEVAAGANVAGSDVKEDGRLDLSHLRHGPLHEEMARQSSPPSA
jgi:hypothetical protein